MKSVTQDQALSTQHSRVGYRLGVDIGGTFTDLVLEERRTGRRLTHKVPTTPEEPARAVLEGIEDLLARAGTTLAAAEAIVHGTTLVTNAILERKGARTALLTTEGFRDVLEARLELAYDPYDIHLEFPRPLVPRRLRIGIPERLRYDGSVERPLDRERVAAAAEALAREGIEAVAICFLHAYVNAAHEREARAIVQAAMPKGAVSISAEVLPEIGEYGRASTTVANAYVQPIASRYLDRLEDGLRERGHPRPLIVVGANGGTMLAGMARAFPVRLVESGPAAGAHAAAALARARGRRQVLAFDMGGTTAKVCFVRDGQPLRTTAMEVARLHRFKKRSGLLLKVPAIDLMEIGAGGGSIAAVDGLGLLTVGPESAGADPGSACYGRGGDRATVTDADLLLGYLGVDTFLGGRMALDRAAAERSVATRVGRRLGRDAVGAALGIFDVVNESMATAIGVYAAEKGLDVRELDLLAFGGAGPVHAWALARSLGIPRVRVPAAAGVLSALGCVLAPFRFDLATSYKGAFADLDLGRLNELLGGMEAEGRARLAEAGHRGRVLVSRSADLRYLGQVHEVNVELPAGPMTAAKLRALEAAFGRRYRALYARGLTGVPVEAVHFRVIVASPAREGRERHGAALMGLRVAGARPVFFPEAGRFVETPILRQDGTGPRTRWRGPAIVELPESTLVVPPGATLAVEAGGDLAIALERAGGRGR